MSRIATVDDPTVKTVQLHEASDESALPVVGLGSGQTIRLAFDVLTDDGGRPLDVTFVHMDREGNESLLATEYMTSFDRDYMQDFRPSGTTDVRYVHYEYEFPNATIGFRISGNYRIRVSDGGGEPLLERPFFVTENLASVTLAYGATLAGGLSSGFSIQPAARLEPGPQLDAFQAFQYTVCFGRDGRLDALRCAPEPTLVQQALYQYYLPESAAFTPVPPRFAINIGLLALSDQVIDVDRAARPPTVTLDIDYAEFGGEVTSATNVSAPIISSVFQDVGRPDTDAEYVDVRFRYAPASRAESARPLYVLGAFNGWQIDPGNAMTWNAEDRVYEATLLLKQGSYVYGYALPGGPPVRGIAIGQQSVFTALVYLSDPARFSDRLIAVESIVAR